MITMLPYAFLGIDLTKLKLDIQGNVCIPMFTAKLIAIDKRYRQPKWPSMDERISTCSKNTCVLSSALKH